MRGLKILKEQFFNFLLLDGFVTDIPRQAVAALCRVKRYRERGCCPFICLLMIEYQRGFKQYFHNIVFLLFRYSLSDIKREIYTFDEQLKINRWILYQFVIYFSEQFHNVRCEEFNSRSITMTFDRNISILEKYVPNFMG